MNSPIHIASTRKKERKLSQLDVLFERFRRPMFNEEEEEDDEEDEEEEEEEEEEGFEVSSNLGTRAASGANIRPWSSKNIK